MSDTMSIGSHPSASTLSIHQPHSSLPPAASPATLSQPPAGGAGLPGPTKNGSTLNALLSRSRLHKTPANPNQPVVFAQTDPHQDYTRFQVFQNTLSMMDNAIQQIQKLASDIGDRALNALGNISTPH